MKKIEKLRKHLLKGAAVTPKQALYWWRYYRLSSGIHRLKKSGLSIKTDIIYRFENGERISYARYRLS